MASRSNSVLPFFKPMISRSQSTGSRPRSLRDHVPNQTRIEFISFCGEFCGTFMFLFMAFAATQLANSAVIATSDSKLPDLENLLYISLAFGFSLAVNAWAFYRISGGLFNPAVTLGMLLIGAVTPLRAVLIFIAQLVAGIAAAAVVEGLFYTPLKVSTTLSAGTSLAQGVFIEMFLTAELVFVIFMLAAEKHKATFLAPIGIGLALFISQMVGVFYTGASLNPARSFGPSVITGFNTEDWIYWIGPLLGTLVAFGFYQLMKYAEYETANPGQDRQEQLNVMNGMNDLNASARPQNSGAASSSGIFGGNERIQSSG